MLQPDRLWRPIGLVLALASLVTLAWWLASPRAAFLVAIVASVVVLVAASVLVGPARLVARDTAGAHLPPEQRASAMNSARTTLVQGVVGLAALAGIFVAWQQLQTDRAQLTEQLTLTRQGQVAERFTRAVDQLGSQKLEQRLGGIYGLERVAEESTSTRLQVFEVLTAYVRQHARQDPPGDLNPRHRYPPELVLRAPDVQAVLTVLGRRTVMAGDPRIDLRETNLRGAELNGARLQGARLDGAELIGARLYGAQLQGATLNWAYLFGARLDGAQLQGANLKDARLNYANLNGAQLQGATLIRAQLGGATLDGVQLQGAQDSHYTGWPIGFDREAAGVIRVREP